MSALLEAAKYLAKNFSLQQIQIYSDSNLLVQTINQGWKKKANQDLWMELEKYLTKINFQLNWVKAHATDRYNNQCDKLALAAAQKAQKQAGDSRRVPILVAGAKKSPPSKVTTSKKPAGKKSEQASLF